MNYIYVIQRQCEDYESDMIFSYCSSLEQAREILSQLESDRNYNYYSLEVWKVPLDHMLVTQISMPQDRDPNWTIPSFEFGELIMKGGHK